MVEIHAPGDEPLVGPDRLIATGYSTHAGFVHANPEEPAIPVVLVDLDILGKPGVKLMFEVQGAHELIQAVENALVLIENALRSE